MAVLGTAGCTALPGDLAPSGAVIRSEKQRLQPPEAAAGDLAELVAGNTAFAFDLYEVLRQEGQDNLFYSPYSISLALAMTYAGARGETASQMAETLHYTLSQPQLHPAFNVLDQALTSSDNLEEDGFQLRIANAIWGQQGYEFLPTFLDALAENYGAGLRTVDFVEAAERVRQTINKWVSDQTEEKIQDLIPPGTLNELTRLVLTNAIYFNGKWVTPFDTKGTRDRDFHLLDGSTVSVLMMTQSGRIQYMAGEGYQAAALPYRDSNMAMLFLLPAEDRFDEIEAQLSSGFLTSIAKAFEAQRVRITMPKFSFESSFNLTEALVGMGMPDAFQDADFSGMTGNRDLFISNVLHKAYVAVDEEGTEAAAATAVIMELTAMRDEPIDMKIDRPFLFLIRDNDTGTILFVGRVLNPQA
jgi:serpin B